MKVTIGPYKDEGDRREEVVIHNYDTWSMDHTFALIALPMLKQLQANKHGAPNVDDEDVPDELKSTSAPPKENDWDTDANHFKRWDWVMDEMIHAMTAIVHDDEDTDYNIDDDTFTVSEIESVGIGPAQLLLFPDEFGKTEVYELYEMKRTGNRPRFDYDKYKAREDRINNGTRLFGKYFRSLWD